VKRIEELLSLSTGYLESKGVAQPRREAEELLAAVLGCKRLDLYLQFDRPCNQVETDQMREWIARRAKGEPAQYIVGHLSFFGCEIGVAPGVLIPRPETELLVDQIARTIEGKGRLLDLCCGSGCIAIALKKKFSNLEVVGSDLSADALEQAKANALRNEVEIEWVQGDLFENVKGEFDYIVSNPPYIAQNELDGLQAEVRDWEPREALVAGPTGLEFYERIACESPAFKRLWLEIGSGQGEAVRALFWGRGDIAQDWSGHDRFFALEAIPQSGVEVE